MAQDRGDIRDAIASFDSWHYEFELQGVKTPVSNPRYVNRHQQRADYIIRPLIRWYGGTLKGKRVLDLGCNAGFWSLLVARAECDYVLGLDGRRMHVDQANFVFEVSEIPRNRYDFVLADALSPTDVDLEGFDIVLCLGLMYHVGNPRQLVETIGRSRPSVVIVDTTLTGLPGSFLELKRERTEDPRSGIRDRLVAYPSRAAVAAMLDEQGLGPVYTLKPSFSSYVGCRDYRWGLRRAFVGGRDADLDSFAPVERSNLFRRSLDPLCYMGYLLAKRMGGNQV